MKNIHLLVYLVGFLFVSCELRGNLFIYSLYTENVMLHSLHEHNGKYTEQNTTLRPNINRPLAAHRPVELNNVISMVIKNTDGEIIAEYPSDYIMQLRRLYKSEKDENWVLSEKGLFLFDTVARERQKAGEDIDAYYRSDEAVNDLEERLKANE